ncbi:GRP family sugar transporter [Orbus sasakiae]|uniref:GRP family sugar transporter n=1 Tax=Orbus sasakiae TaxID=1078475 RepID=A0ABP9N920_9GAMM
MEILIALLPALGWGIQPLILKKLGGKPTNQILGTGIGAIIVGLIVQFSSSPDSISLTIFLISLASGVFWVIGQTGQYHALDIMGVSKTIPVSTALQLIGTSIISVIAFNEWPGLTFKLIGLAAIILLIIGVAMTSVSEKKADVRSLKLGVMILFYTSAGYWIYNVLPKMVNAPALSIFFPQMLGIFLGALVYILFKHPKSITESKTWQTAVVGIIFSLSALAYIFAAKLTGVATAFIITQLNVVVATIGSLVILKERKTPKELKSTLVGLALIVVGSVITIFI